MKKPGCMTQKARITKAYVTFSMDKNVIDVIPSYKGPGAARLTSIQSLACEPYTLLSHVA